MKKIRTTFCVIDENHERDIVYGEDILIVTNNSCIPSPKEFDIGDHSSKWLYPYLYCFTRVNEKSRKVTVEDLTDNHRELFVTPAIQLNLLN